MSDDDAARTSLPAAAATDRCPLSPRCTALPLFAVRSHNPNSKKSQIIAGIPNVGLCHRCHDIIEWRKKFRKYKPIKNLAKW